MMPIKHIQRYLLFLLAVLCAGCHIRTREPSTPTPIIETATPVLEASRQNISTTTPTATSTSTPAPTATPTPTPTWTPPPTATPTVPPPPPDSSTVTPTSASNAEKIALPYFTRGKALYDQGNPRGALPAFNQAISLWPEYSAAYRWRAWVYHDLLNYKAAVDDLSQALEFHPGGPEKGTVYMDRGFMYSTRGDIDAALADYTEALVHDPSLIQALIYRASIHRTRGNWPAAIADLDQAVAIAPEAHAAWHVRGTYHAELGNTALARADLERALVLAEDDPDAARIIAWELRKLGGE